MFRTTLRTAVGLAAFIRPVSYPSKPLLRPASSMSAPFKLDPSIFNQDLYDRVQATWFATQPPTDKAPTEASSKRWFNNPDKADALHFDTACRDNFQHALHTLFPEHVKLPPATSRADELRDATILAAPFLEQLRSAGDRAPLNALSLVLLLDQMPRNIFRAEQKVIYTHLDRLSRALVYSLLGHGEQAPLLQSRPDHAPGIKDVYAKRMWFYMPLMHSEHVEDHELSARYMAEMKSDPECNCEEAVGRGIEMMEGFEEKHAVIIRKFGRYPYRNEKVGRETTAEEKEWLESGGDRFGS